MYITGILQFYIILSFAEDKDLRHYVVLSLRELLPVSSVDIIHRRISRYCSTLFSVMNHMSLNIKCEVLNGYVYEPTRCTNLAIRIDFLLDALHVSDFLVHHQEQYLISCTVQLVYAGMSGCSQQAYKKTCGCQFRAQMPSWNGVIFVVCGVHVRNLLIYVVLGTFTAGSQFVRQRKKFKFHYRDQLVNISLLYENNP